MSKLAAALISLADHPHDVVWRPREVAFEVPESVAVKYGQQVADTETAPAGEAVEKVAPARKARAPHTAATGRRARGSRKSSEGGAVNG